MNTKRTFKLSIPEMITIILLVAYSLLSTCAMAQTTSPKQDVIVYKNGTEMIVKILEVSGSEVKFKKQDNLDGPTFVVAKTDLFKIKYANGTEEVFSSPTPVTWETPSLNENKRSDDQTPEIRHYSGPRIGMTFVGPGAFEDQLLSEGKRTVYSQFGWQFETRVFTLSNGVSGLFEFVPMIGGLDMGKFIPSFSGLMGIRTKAGYEFGAGPNWAIYSGRNQYGYYSTSSSVGVVLAAGMSLKVDKVYFPINIAVVPSVTKQASVMDPITYQTVQVKYQTGVKVTLLIGFNSRKN